MYQQHRAQLRIHHSSQYGENALGAPDGSADAGPPKLEKQLSFVEKQRAKKKAAALAAKEAEASETASVDNSGGGVLDIHTIGGGLNGDRLRTVTEESRSGATTLNSTSCMSL